MGTLSVDRTRCRVAIHTFVDGALSAVAHELSILAPPGLVTISDDERRAELEFPVRELRVEGVYRRGHLDTSGLSGLERRQIESRMHTEVFGGAPAVLAVVDHADDGWRATLRTNDRSSTTAIQLRRDQLHVTGEARVSLSSLGLRPIKGPLGLFRVADEVHVTFDLWLKR